MLQKPRNARATVTENCHKKCVCLFVILLISLLRARKIWWYQNGDAFTCFDKCPGTCFVQCFYNFSGHFCMHRYMATSGMDRQLKIFDVRTFKPLQAYRVPYGAGALCFSQRGLLAAACGNVVEVSLFTLKPLQALSAL